MRQYAAALEREDVNRAQVGASKHIAWLILGAVRILLRVAGIPWAQGQHAKGRRNVLERFRAEHGHRPLKDLQSAQIRSIIGAKANTPEAANNLLKFLRVILNYAVSERMIASNPAIGVKRYRSKSEGIHTWTEAEVEQFEACHPIGNKARLAFELMLCTAQRRSDAVRMDGSMCKETRSPCAKRRRTSQ